MRTPLVLTLLVACALSACNPGNSKNSNVANLNGNSNSGVVDPGNTKPPEPSGPVDPNFKACNPYFPLIPGSRRIYTMSSSSGLISTATAVVDNWEENGRKGFKETIRLVDTSGGYKLNQLIERHYVCDGDKVQILYEKTDNNVEGEKSLTEFFYREPSYAMIEPSSLKTGAKWTESLKVKIQRPGQSPIDMDTPTIVEFTVLDAQEIQLPTGKVKALLVYRKVGGNEINDYFVPGLGFVRRNAKEGNKWELKEYSGLKPLEMPGK